MFRKTASAEVLGVHSNNGWSKSASKFASAYMSGVEVSMEEILDMVHDTYQISRDPRDYLLVPTRASSVDRPNENLDGWEREEVLSYSPYVGQRVYATYVSKPHFVNHNASNPKLARGVILDAHYNNLNDASDSVKKAVFEATGREVEKDEFIETLIAVDMRKDPALAAAYKNGSVYRFSMGCDVEATRCSACDNVATTAWEFCPCIRNKHARVPVQTPRGPKIAHEWCIGTIFAEESAVDDPADKMAEVQDGLLTIASYSGGEDMKRAVAAFVVKNSGKITGELAELLTKVLDS